MPNKLKIASIAILLLVVTFFITSKLAEKPLEVTPKIAMNFIKCTSTNFLLEDIDTTKQISPLFTNLGNLNFTISTTNDRVQAFFNQGMKLSYAFNHAESHRSFLEAARLAPKVAMNYWGQAFALGPNINDPQPTDDRKLKCVEAITKAQELSATATPKEGALIEALSQRYSTDLTVEQATLNKAYMTAMMSVVEKYPDDANVQILYAASVMNTVPWNYWDKDGQPSPNVKEAKAALEKARKYAEAEKVFKEDLVTLRQNGWSLMGLYQCLELQGKVEEAKAVKIEFDEARKYADFKISSAVL